MRLSLFMFSLALVAPALSAPQGCPPQCRTKLARKLYGNCPEACESLTSDERTWGQPSWALPTSWTESLPQLPMHKDNMKLSSRELGNLAKRLDETDGRYGDQGPFHDF